MNMNKPIRAALKEKQHNQQRWHRPSAVLFIDNNKARCGFSSDRERFIQVGLTFRYFLNGVGVYVPCVAHISVLPEMPSTAGPIKNSPFATC